MKTEPNECEMALDDYRHTPFKPSELMGDHIALGFRAGWAARGYAITPEFKQGYDLAKAEINAADKVLKSKAALNLAITKNDTFSDRLNALTKALGEIKAMNWEKPYYRGTVDSPVAYPPEEIAIDCLLSTIVRECGGAK